MKNNRKNRIIRLAAAVGLALLVSAWMLISGLGQEAKQSLVEKESDRFTSAVDKHQDITITPKNMGELVAVMYPEA